MITPTGLTGWKLFLLTVRGDVMRMSKEVTLLGWDNEQWRTVEQGLGRRRGSLNIHYVVGTYYDRFADAQAEWYKRFNCEPNRGCMQEESKMSGQRIDFGFDCKVTSMGWREDFLRGGQVYELRVRVGNASFGSQQFVSMTRTMMARDDGFLRALERRAIENLKREIVDKLFPNL